MNYIWEIKETSQEGLQLVVDEFKLPETIATIMAQRGIKNREISRSFFYPDLNKLHDPFLMLGMEKAVKYIQNLIQSNKTILLFGDYDVDGTTGTSTMYLFFKSIA